MGAESCGERGGCRDIGPVCRQGAAPEGWRAYRSPLVGNACILGVAVPDPVPGRNYQQQGSGGPVTSAGLAPRDRDGGTRRGCHRPPSLLSGTPRATAGQGGPGGGPGAQLTAFFTSAAILASSAAVSSFSAK
jgi:hypothetical protein